MKLEFYTYNLELIEPFKISYGTRHLQSTLIVSISDGYFTGYGEAAATSYYGVSVEHMQKDIKAVEPLISQNITKSPEDIWKLTWPKLKNNPFAQCALDIALHDLNGKRCGKKLYQIWGLSLKNMPFTSFTISIDTTENMIEKIKNMPWPIYKIKMGSKDDMHKISMLRKYTSSIFRIDANASWGLNETLYNAKVLKELNVEFLEQPLKADDWEGMAELNKDCVLPLIADESCIQESDIEKCATCFDGVNIKLTKCGGLTPAKRMIFKAKSRGLKVMVGCMTESTVGISAIAHLLPLLDYVDMDGVLLIKNDVADGVKIDNGKILFSEANGTGVHLYDTASSK